MEMKEKFYISLAILSIIVLFLHKFGPLEGQASFIGWLLFTTLCIAIAFEKRHSKLQLLFVGSFYLVYGIGIYL